LAKHGDLERLRELLTARRREEIDINAYDHSGRTPLMHAVSSPKANVEMVRLLLEYGADIHQEDLEADYGIDDNLRVIALALSGGDPQKVMALLESGADLHYKTTAGSDALIAAVCGRDVLRDPQLIELLKLLIARGVELSGVDKYCDSGLRLLSRYGRFDAIQLLLDAGADETQLEWTPLIRAVALGSLAEVKKEVETGVSLEGKEWWERTAWLVAVQTGDIDKARFLLERGADANARGRCKKPPLFYAIENHHTPMLQWLLEIGTSVEQTDEFGDTPLMTAVENDNAEAVDVLLKAGANVNVIKGYSQTAFGYVRTREVATKFLDAGADPGELPYKGRRALVGFDPEPDEYLIDVSPSEFSKGRSRRFGTSNPEEIVKPFWEGMIRSGITAFQAAQLYEGRVEQFNSKRVATDRDVAISPIWCAQRFGQSITFLPDGRIVQVAGEHEDSYDQDFCIYNDVFVHEPGGAIHIFAYPESVFPPTDSHTATLVGEHIYLIGSLGYQGTRQYGKTPVYRLHIKTFRIEQVNIGGDAPGWIYDHQAVLLTPHEIRIFGGKIVTADNPKGRKNDQSFVLDTERLVWGLSQD
jgi:ankyrin repeat protein